MMLRISAVALNAYREAVRARVLHALFGLALAVTGYSLVLGSLTRNQDARVIADVGMATGSLFAIVLSVTLAATMLHREVELKTLYPILTRRLLRHEYILGKFLGIYLTVLAFLVTDSALTLTLLAAKTEQPWTLCVLAVGAFALVFATVAWWRTARTYALLPAAAAFLAMAALAAGPANGERQLVLAQLLLSGGEIAVVLGITLLFASFSSPFLTAACTLGVFVLGRSADTLANLPAHLFGEFVRAAGAVLSKGVPNLQIFVPERPLLLGHADASTWSYVSRSLGLAGAYAIVLLALSSLIFARRDFE